MTFYIKFCWSTVFKSLKNVNLNGIKFTFKLKVLN